MGFVFDGENKIISCTLGTTVLDVQDAYSRWKDWVIDSDNAKYLQALSVVGGDPTVSGMFLGTTFFLENGWKFRPQEASHTLVVNGNLYSRDGSNPFVQTLGTYNVLVSMRVSNLIDTVATSGSVLTKEEIRQEMDNNSVKLKSILGEII